MKREEVFRSDPKLIGGAPAFTGTHLAVDNLIVHLKNGYSLDQFLEHFRGVSRQQVVALLSYGGRCPSLAGSRQFCQAHPKP